MDGFKDWQVVAIIPAAGVGRRMQGESKRKKQKLLLELAGESIFLRSMKALNLPEIEAFFVPVTFHPGKFIFVPVVKKDKIRSLPLYQRSGRGQAGGCRRRSGWW